MRKSVLRISPALLVFVLAILACDAPTVAPIVLTETSTPTAALITDTPTLSLPTEQIFIAIPTIEEPLVLRGALCWWGPGAAYDVMSALGEGIHVELLGRGNISGWWVVDNPIYHVPCWVHDADLRIDPATDLTSLKIFIAPPTSTPTVVPTKTPTPTWTP